MRSSQVGVLRDGFRRSVGTVYDALGSSGPPLMQRPPSLGLTFESTPPAPRRLGAVDEPAERDTPKKATGDRPPQFSA